MEVQVSKEPICINKLVAKRKEICNVAGDIIVPDTKPDILNSINISGITCIYKKEIMENKVKIEGNIDTYIMYLPDSNEDNLRGLNCNLDFSENIAIPSITNEMNLEVTTNIREMECNVVNGRKINVKAKIEFCIKIYSNENLEIISQINNIENIQTLKKQFDVNCLIGSGKTKVYAKENLKIDNQDEFAEILKTDVSLINKDIKLSYNKVLAKVEAEIKILYLTEDNRIGKCEKIVPAVGFIDIQNISENNICNINYDIKNINIKPSQGDGKDIYVELEIEENCMVYEKKQIDLIQDLYSPTEKLEFSQVTIDENINKKDIEKELDLTGVIEDIDIDAENILDTEINTNILDIKISKSKITYSGELNINFIFTKDNTIDSKKSKIPFEIFVENIFESEEINEDSNIYIKKADFNLNNGKINYDITLSLNVNLSQNVKINIIDNIEVEEINDEEEDYDSLILYITKPGDSLWKIAKKFNTTIDELVRMNGIEDENKINIGQKIYIPKFNHVKKEVENEKEPTFV